MKNSLRSTVFVIAMTSVVLTGAKLLGAAEPRTLSDDFRSLNPGWEVPKEQPADRLGVTTEGLKSRLRLKATQGQAALTWRSGFSAYEIDVRADVWLEGGKNAHAGIIFWAENESNYYAFQFTSDRNIAVARRTAGSLTYPMAWKQCDTVDKLDFLGWVKLRVATKGNRAELLVNDKLMATVSGLPPVGGGQIGFLHQAATAEDGVAFFSDFQAIARDSAAPDPSVLLADDFEKLDPAWGRLPEGTQLKDNSLFCTVPTNGIRRFVHSGFSTRDMDLSVELRLIGAESTIKAGDSATAGVIFWSGESEFYAFVVGSERQLGVLHWANDQWSNPLDFRTGDIAKIDLKKWITLRVVTVEARAMVYANGVLLKTFRRAPTSTPAYQVGLWSNSTGVGNATVEFAKLRIVRPVEVPEKSNRKSEIIAYDDFATMKPEWGAPEERILVQEGSLAITTNPDREKFAVYGGATESDMDVRTMVKLDGRAAEGGVMFWANEGREYHAMIVNRDATISVFRSSKKKAVTLLDRVAVPAAGIDPSGWNELRVLIRGHKAELFANGTSVQTLSLEEEPLGNSLGLYMSSPSDARSTARFADFVVTRPKPVQR